MKLHRTYGSRKFQSFQISLQALYKPTETIRSFFRSASKVRRVGCRLPRLIPIAGSHDPTVALPELSSVDEQTGNLELSQTARLTSLQFNSQACELNCKSNLWRHVQAGAFSTTRCRYRKTATLPKGHRKCGPATMKSGSMFDIGARVCGWFMAKEYETKSTSSGRRGEDTKLCKAKEEVRTKAAF